MADQSLVRVEILRPYPWGGIIRSVGSVVEVPPASAERMVEARPPKGRILDGDDPEPLEPIEDVELDADFDATEGALDLARALKFDLTPYSGQGSGTDGRIWKTDVEEWAGR